MSGTSATTKPPVDLEKVPGTDHHRAAVTFNCFILKSLEILNNFGNNMEETLDRAERGLTQADRKLRLMEAKLSQIHLDDEAPEMTLPSSEAPGAAKPREVEDLKDPEVPEVPEASRSLDPAEMKSSEAPESPSTVSGIPRPPQAAPRTMKVEAEAPVPASRHVILVKDDPAYSRYFKMLKMGVPEAGVIQKMASEGVDPAILQRGDEPSRLKDQKTLDDDSEGETGDSFSDSN